MLSTTTINYAINRRITRSFASHAMHERPPPYTTHPVLNQSSLLFSNNFTQDHAIQDATRVYLGSAFNKHVAALSDYGSWAGSEATANLARTANTLTPTIRNFDRNGRRIDVVDYHPAYHHIYEHATVSGVPSFAWRNEAEHGAHVVRGALAMMHYQAESGSSCPLTMTFAGVPALQTSESVFKEWITRSCATAYDPANKPISEKAGVVLGMSMTEKAGGSDVRSNTTTAVPMNSNVSTEAGEPYLLKGHKWFTSAPMCDGFLTLAYTDVPASAGKGASKALSCFLVPRWLSDGTRNTGFRVVRLKEKLGDKSNASSEVEYDNAVGYLLGPIGRGVPTILEMVVHTRLDCALGSAGLMRLALRNTAHYCSQRKAFGVSLHQAPAMTALLVDLAAESEAAVWMSLHMAATFDRCLQAPDNVSEQAFRRLAVAVTKYFVCKQTPGVVNEALEGIGGNGYVEEWDFPRWFRQSPLNSVWEGSGNVIAMDIQRTLAKEPLALSSFFSHLSATSGANADLDSYVKDLYTFVKQGAAVDPHNARYFAETCALALQGHCLVNAAKQTGSESVDATARYWCATRLKPAACRLYGSRLASDPKMAASILDRLIAPLA